MVVAQALCENIKNNQLAQTLASSGFRDTTRLAMTNTELAEDMINFNGKNIEKALKKFTSETENLRSDYRKKIEIIAAKRRKMYSKDGKNIL